jgi:hypothetical protein
MRISPPEVVVYACTFDQATEIACSRALLHCEPQSHPMLLLEFKSGTDLLHFMFEFSEEVDFEGNFALVRPTYQDQVESFLAVSGIGSRVTRGELLAVMFWDTDDQTAFDTELSIAWTEP